MCVCMSIVGGGSGDIRQLANYKFTDSPEIFERLEQNMQLDNAKIAGAFCELQNCSSC